MLRGQAACGSCARRGRANALDWSCCSLLSASREFPHVLYGVGIQLKMRVLQMRVLQWCRKKMTCKVS